MSNNALTNKYSVNSIAKAFGVDRNALTVRLTDAGIDTSDGVTLHDAFCAWARREASEDARRRRNVAEAETAEMQNAEKKGTLMLTSKHLRWVRDIGTRVRAVITSSSLSEDAKKKLCAEISRIKITS